MFPNSLILSKYGLSTRSDLTGKLKMQKVSQFIILVSLDSKSYQHHSLLSSRTWVVFHLLDSLLTMQPPSSKFEVTYTINHALIRANLSFDLFRHELNQCVAKYVCISKSYHTTRVSVTKRIIAFLPESKKSWRETKFEFNCVCGSLVMINGQQITFCTHVHNKYFVATSYRFHQSLLINP